MLKIDNTVLPTPKSITYSHNKLWSQNTGRLDSGYFVGELIAIKRKYEVVFPPLTMAEYAVVKANVNNEFATVEITEDDGTTSTVIAYFGDLTVEAYSWCNGLKYAVNASVAIIER